MKMFSILSLTLLASCVEVGENGASSTNKSSSKKRKCYYNKEKVSCKEFDRFTKNKQGKPLTNCEWTKAKSLFEGLNDYEKETRKKGYTLEMGINVCNSEINTEFDFAKITDNDVTDFSLEEIQNLLTETKETIDGLSAEYLHYQAIVWGSEGDAQKLENLILNSKLVHLYQIQEKISQDEEILPEINVESLDQYTIPKHLVD